LVFPLLLLDIWICISRPSTTFIFQRLSCICFLNRLDYACLEIWLLLEKKKV
jgi:hypothetical protein